MRQLVSHFGMHVANKCAARRDASVGQAHSSASSTLWRFTREASTALCDRVSHLCCSLLYTEQATNPMPTLRHRRPRKVTIAAFDDCLILLKRIVGRLIRTRVTVGRDVHDAETAALRQLEQRTNHLEHHARDRETQFKRITQVHAELDVIECVWTKATIG